MLRGASIICLSSIDWAFNRQHPQEVASAFGASGNGVLFVENTGVRRAAFRDLGRLRIRFANWWRSRGRAKPAGNGVDVFSPLLLPFPYSDLAGRINAAVLLRVIRRWLRDRGEGPLIIITFLPTPLVRAVIRGLDPALVVYYCIDRLAESSPGARKLRASEPRLLAEADLVLVSSTGLRSAAALVAPRVELLPTGVRFEAFERARRSPPAPPAVFTHLSGPVAGFVGSLRGSTDLALLEQAADLAPDLNFVFVGPVFTDVRRLAARANVRLVAPVPHAEVMAYMAHFDVGILPYVMNGFTADVMPVKLKEYLAAGLPVVATPLPEVRRFADEHPQVITFAEDAPSFVAALRAAIATKDLAAVDRRVAVARRYDWSAQMARMSDLIEALLAARMHRLPETRRSA